jgi:hypothetical protein
MPASLRIGKGVPVPVRGVGAVGDDLHEVDGHWPADTEQEEHYTIEPVVIPVDLLLTDINLLLLSL